MNKDQIAQPDKVLIAMYRVSDGSAKRLVYEDIVISAWKEFPEAFSLRNHPEFPDSEHIHKKIHQNLKPKGLAVVLGEKIFRLTDKGIQRAEGLLGVKARKGLVDEVKLTRDEEMFYSHAITSQAYMTWKNKNPEALIDYDARLFFQFSTGTKINERKYKADFALETLNHALKLGLSEADNLRKLTDYLIKKFNHLFMEEKHE